MDDSTMLMIASPPLFALPPILERQFLHNTLQVWLTAGITTAVIAVLGLLLRQLLASRLGAVASRTTNQIDDMVVDLIRDTRAWVIIALAVFAGLSQLAMPDREAKYLESIAKLVLLWQAAVWGGSAITFWLKHYLSNRTTSQDRTSIAMISAMGVGSKVLLWVLIVLTALKSVFGVEITAWITGLGVTGIAIALAVQNILGDLLAALAIVFDKPFDVGDTIGVDTITGTVEHIGLKTTRLRSLSGEQVIIGNGDLLKTRIRNYRRMYQRRVVFNLDVTYDTPPEVLERLPAIVREIVSAQSPVKFDRCHVASFGESAIRLETVYYVLDPDYARYMDVQQAVNLEVLRRFAAQRVSFAFPSRTVYHEGPLAKDLMIQPGDTE
ncbi:MAG TPA: mechanosensitive ion channel family protein [Gemmatimonadaceae bacterium]|jgi:small-conductance mechanosensitive channel|nr:mechanosensitive ion channel family protein [Gemmatimonadaceae bacterium]